MQENFLNRFAKHKTAVNLLMLAIIASGLWALHALNIQFFPTFKLNIITVKVSWPSANSENIVKAITIPVEEKLHDIDNLKKISSTTRPGLSTIILEFTQDANMTDALEQVKQNVGLVKNFPLDAEKPTISREIFYEAMANLLVTSSSSLAELYSFSYNIEQQLLNRGVPKIGITGLPEQDILIQVPQFELYRLNLPLSQLAAKITAENREFPIGAVGGLTAKREFRTPYKVETVSQLSELPIAKDSTGHIVRLGDFAKVVKTYDENQVLATVNGKPTAELTLYRTEFSNTLTLASKLQNWLKEYRPKIPSTIKMTMSHQLWKLIKERINLLLKNGVVGLLLVLAVLFLFLNIRIAFWVAVGIPISFLGAMLAMHFLGRSINMISLFAMIMTLGIIVDDSIVVGEETLSQLHKGKSLIDAVKIGTNSMLKPVIASSLTTIAAFIPLLLLSDIMGQVLLDIPLVVICVIVASLIECFLILPGHIYHSFCKKTQSYKKAPILDNVLNKFREKIFRPLLKILLNNSWTVLAVTFAVILITFGVLTTGRINFTFFPDPEGNRINLSAQFAAGTPEIEIKQFIAKLNVALNKTDLALRGKSKSLITSAISYERRGVADEPTFGNEFASMKVELISSEKRKLSTNQFINAWRQNITAPPGVENFTISAPRGGPPGADLAFELSNTNIGTLKTAAEKLEQELRSYPGVYNIRDNLPYGKEHLVYNLTPQGKMLGLNISDVGNQLRAAFSGKRIEIIHEPNQEIEIKAILPKVERDNIHTLERMPILTPQGRMVPLNTVAKISSKTGFDILRRIHSHPAITVSADINSKVANANKVANNLKRSFLPNLMQKYNLRITKVGRLEDQQETLQEMLYGLILALFFIYIILAWVFSSYGWPFIIMSVIPIGLTGAILGHLVMGLDLTILSLFGLFGLSGIVVNDSIILVNRYKYIKSTGKSTIDALVDAACDRLRPVLLTSVTTVVGLAPLLFETSRQARFIIPMAVSISFGLAFTTLLILFVVPSMLMIYDNFILGFRKS